MPILRFYPNGATSGNPPTMSDHKRAKRSEVIGWSTKSARSQRNWFFSVDINGLSGFAVSVTLTVRDCPPSADEFHRMRTNFIKRLRDSHGLVRGHWLIEWQRRGVPHMHGCFYFAGTDNYPDIPGMWCDIAEAYGARRQGQHVAPIYDTVGWLKYLAKHGARGVHHYQRSNDNMPEGWSKTGRMWGYVGDWPLREAMRFSIDREGFWQFRRIVQRWCVADARSQRDWDRVRFVRHMLRCKERPLSEVRGTADWMPLDASTRIVVWLGGQGYDVDQVWEDDK